VIGFARSFGEISSRRERTAHLSRPIQRPTASWLRYMRDTSRFPSSCVHILLFHIGFCSTSIIRRRTPHNSGQRFPTLFLWRSAFGVRRFGEPSRFNWHSKGQDEMPDCAPPTANGERRTVNAKPSPWFVSTVPLHVRSPISFCLPTSAQALRSGSLL
jgi:hypothetical protein